MQIEIANFLRKISSGRKNVQHDVFIIILSCESRTFQAHGISNLHWLILSKVEITIVCVVIELSYCIRDTITSVWIFAQVCHMDTVGFATKERPNLTGSRWAFEPLLCLQNTYVHDSAVIQQATIVIQMNCRAIVHTSNV
jgi:hypothetical protein